MNADDVPFDLDGLDFGDAVRPVGEWAEFDVPDDLDRRCLGWSRSFGRPCLKYPTNGFDRCRNHGGSPGSGAQEDNQNGAKHHLHSDPGKLVRNLEGERRVRYEAMYDALCERYADVHGEPDALAREHVRRVAIESIKLELADEWMSERGVDGNPLVEEREEATERGISRLERPSMLHSIADKLRRENRQWLKDMGLMPDPESEKADAMRDVGDAYIEALKEAEDGGVTDA